MIEVVGLQQPDEFVGHDVAAAKHRHAARQCQHAPRQGVALHRHAALGKAQIEHRLHPPGAAHDGALVGGQRAQFAVGGEQRQAFAAGVRRQDEVAVHEHDQIVIAKTRARDGAQDRRDGHALAGHDLADHAERDVEIVGDQLEVVLDDVFVEAVAGAEPDGGGHAGIADLRDDAANDGFRDVALLAERRHHEVHAARPPAGVPQRGRAFGHARIDDPAEDPGAHGMRQPPRIAPDAEEADDVGELLNVGVPDRILEHHDAHQADAQIECDLADHERRPLLEKRQGLLEIIVVVLMQGAAAPDRAHRADSASVRAAQSGLPRGQLRIGVRQDPHGRRRAALRGRRRRAWFRRRLRGWRFDRRDPGRRHARVSWRGADWAGTRPSGSD